MKKIMVNDCRVEFVLPNEERIQKMGGGFLPWDGEYVVIKEKGKKPKSYRVWQTINMLDIDKNKQVVEVYLEGINA